MLNYPMWKEKMIVLVTMVLYNYICEHKSSDMDFDRMKRDEDYKLAVPKRYNKYVVASDGSTPLHNFRD
jgi:hypothetical protein